MERQRRYAEHLRALHVVVKTGRGAGGRFGTGAMNLAPNAWAYPTRSRSRYAFVPDAVRLAGAICRREEIDVVSAQDPFATGLVAYLVARRHQLPLNVQVHFDVLDDPFWVAERAEHRALNTLGKWLLRRADTIRVGTTHEAAKLATWGIDPERIYIAPVPVDLERFRDAPPDPRLRQGLAHGGAVVLNASRLVPQKDLPTLLRAAVLVRRQRPGTRFVIAGDGPLRAELEELAATLGVSEGVRFLGRIDRVAMPGLFAACDVLAVSSVYEGTSLVAVEAAASGKPVVTTQVAGAADTVLDGQTGRIVPLQHPGALAEALLSILADPARAARMGEAGRAHVGERFALDRAVQQVISMWTATRLAGVGGACGGGPREETESPHLPGKHQSAKREGPRLPGLPDARRPLRSGSGSGAALPRAGQSAPDGRSRSATPLRPAPPAPDARPPFPRPGQAGHHRPAPPQPRPLPGPGLRPAVVHVRHRGAAHVARTEPGAIYSRDWPVLLAVASAAPWRRRPLFWEAHDLPQGSAARLALRRAAPPSAGRGGHLRGAGGRAAGPGRPGGGAAGGA